MVEIVPMLVVLHAILTGKIYEIYVRIKRQMSYKYTTIGVTMVGDALIHMVKRTVYVDEIIVVDVVNFDIVLITMSTYTRIQFLVNKFTYSTTNANVLFYFIIK